MDKKQYPFSDFVNIMERLTAPDGCPWDRVQTHESLKRYMIEECYEAVDAINNKDSGNLCEELGDVMLQVVFHSIIAKNEGRFDINDVISGISDKMINRHRHIFGDVTANTPEEVLKSWEEIKKEEKGYVVASLGTDSGYVPYTAFSAKKSYIEKNADVIQGFTDALQKGMDYVQKHTPKEIAEAIAPQFKETNLNTIETIVSRYYEQDTWKDNLIFEKKSFELLQDILESAEELDTRAPYDKLVTTTFAEKAAK